MQDKLKTLPDKPGVYLFKDKNGVVLYVGKAKSLRKRVASYFSRPQEIKTSILLSKLRDIDYILAASEMDALLLEDELVKKYKPRYNIALRDDKSYPFLKLTVNEKWPRLFLARRKDKDGALYFGRFRGGMVREVVSLVKKLFPIRWCKESPLKTREQPCLYYRIGSCTAPCVGKISRADYLALIGAIIELLEGKFSAAASQLEAAMRQAAAGQDFERAAYLRNRLKSLTDLIEGKNLARAPLPHHLVALDELQKKLKLLKIPMRIEAFDISNIQGSNIVGALVVFFGGAPLKNDYRRFKVKSLTDKPNDVAAMGEVVARRYQGSLKEKLLLPDLVLIDGGLGQVNAAQKALTAAGLTDLPVIGLAKREEYIFSPGRSQPLILPKNSPGLQLLQRIRDEAHRFVIAFHRRRRARALFG
ncbi:excinuclease ABC subunit UvrC [Candidatus Saganbacteria bacterium]|nr:excinuclease ABC subunit UvrC [Candidatus Saganbacteria bacterium]